ncbi:MAG: DAK2 domain-containing protein [Sciscionella sp.]
MHGSSCSDVPDPDVTAFDADAVRRWAAACVRALETNRASIDAINVFPVADSDTGTNLLHTMRSAVEPLALAPASAPAAELLAAMAAGALTGARGNSGVILSQVLRGFAESYGQPGGVSGVQTLRGALCRADELAAEAVSLPVAGTILTVLHEAATTVPAPARDLAGFVSAVRAAALDALADTQRQLSVLASAEVVDAGALGLVLLIDALSATLGGGAGIVLPGASPMQVSAGVEERYGYEVMYLLDGAEPAGTTALRAALTGIGDCVSVAGDGAGRWTVHVHCDNIGAAIEAGVEAGRPHRIVVTRFADQRAAGEAEERFAVRRAVVALVRGTGTAELFRAEGAVVLVVDSSPPLAADLLAVIAGTTAAHVSVLCTEPRLVEFAEEAAAQARDCGQAVVVVPTASETQGLAALAVHDPERRSESDVVAMAEAAAATLRGALAVAEDEALTWAGRCHPGDVLGSVADEIVLVEQGPVGDEVLRSAACALLDRMLASGGELVTVLLGMDAPTELPEWLEAHLRSAHPAVDLAAYRGDQRDTVVLLGVE